MFMSTRYSKRSEPSIKQRQIFSVNDSLAKLCEYLTNEFSCNKLITPKYKDFRSQKLKFDQKTRLNNAIWRAWHIQYKLSKKARFLQFAPPFSDESSHSTSQAVILEGKYWKKRWEYVSREFVNWRRVYKEKLLRNGGLDKEELEKSAEDQDFSDSDDEHKSKYHHDKKGSKTKVIPKTFDPISAMYALPDTLFSSVEEKKSIPDGSDLSLFKDSSGMIQPTLNHLNPCFDELMENFDFLFTDWDNYNAQPQSSNRHTPNFAMDPQYDKSRILSDDQFLPTVSAQPESSTEHVLLTPEKKSSDFQQFIFPPQGQHRTTEAHTERPMQIMTKVDSIDMLPQKYQELPPQLQAPNLAAHLQATWPKTQNKSDPGTSTVLKRTSSAKKEPSNSSQHRKRIKRNSSTENLGNMQRLQKQSGTTHVMQGHNIHLTHTTPHNVPSVMNKRSSVNAIPILPKYTSVMTTSTSNILPVQSIINPIPQISQEQIRLLNANTGNSSIPAFTVISRGTNHNTVLSPVVPNPSNQQLNQNVYQQGDSYLPNVVPLAFVQTPLHVTGGTSKANQNQNISIMAPNQVNEQQLVTLAQLLQSSPTQSTEATLNYLELLQQQLTLMLKQQQEQIQMKHHIQQQAEKMLQQQQQQLQQRQNVPHSQSANGQTNPQPGVSPIISQSPNTTTTTTTTADLSQFQKTSNSHASPLKSTTLNNMTDSQQSHFHSKSPHIEKTLSSVNANNFHPSTEPPRSISMETKSHATTSSPSYSSFPPATMDSAMALVSLRHGKVMPTSSLETQQVKMLTQCKSAPSPDNEVVPLTKPTNAPMIPKPITQVANRDVYNEHRRQCHLSAEQKRRGLIKNAFEELSNLLPASIYGNSRTKLSNAAILQKTCEHIVSLQHERASCDVRMNQVQQQIDEMNLAISECQNKLPATGISISRKSSDTVQKSFFEYCKELITTNPKSWIFCVVMKPVFDSYNSSVTTKTVDEFLNSVIRWLEQHATLPSLRQVVLDTLTKLSTGTAFLDDPQCLTALAEQSVLKEDPTDFPSGNDNNAISSFSSQWTDSWKK